MDVYEVDVALGVFYIVQQVYVVLKRRLCSNETFLMNSLTKLNIWFRAT